VKFDFVGNFGLVLEARHEFEKAGHVGQFQFDCAIVLLILNDR